MRFGRLSVEERRWPMGRRPALWEESLDARGNMTDGSLVAALDRQLAGRSGTGPKNFLPAKGWETDQGRCPEVGNRP
jgi:hypothetical protein